MQSRKAETRTKIQMGGLIIKSGLAEKLSIVPGDDLQLDIDKRDQAHVLLGILKSVSDDISFNDFTHYLSVGKSLTIMDN